MGRGNDQWVSQLFFLILIFLLIWERETLIFCPIYLFIHWLNLVCALTRSEPETLAYWDDAPAHCATRPGQVSLLFVCSVFPTTRKSQIFSLLLHIKCKKTCKNKENRYRSDWKCLQLSKNLEDWYSLFRYQGWSGVHLASPHWLSAFSSYGRPDGELSE